VVPCQTTGKPYQLTVDLKDFYSDRLQNINLFLLKLSSLPDLICQAVVLENGTSFKFNTLSTGLKGLFQTPTVKKITYIHSSLSSPVTPSTKLKEWGRAAKLSLERDGNKLTLTKGETFYDDAASVASSVQSTTLVQMTIKNLLM
jgi:hypothetical protein